MDEDEQDAEELDGEPLEDDTESPETSKTTESTDEKAGGTAAEQKWWYGWDKQLKRAWRVPIDNKTAPKEWSTSPRFGEHAKRSDPVEVSFTDGSIYYVPSFTVGQLTAL